MVDSESKSKSAAGMATATASMKKPMGKKFRRIVIEPTDNGGAIVEHHPPHEEMQKVKGEMRYMPSPEPTKTAFTTAEEAHAHVGSVMGVKAGKNAGADSESTPGKSKNDKSGKMKASDTKDEGQDEEEDDED